MPNIFGSTARKISMPAPEPQRASFVRSLALQYQIIGQELMRFESAEASTRLAGMRGYSGFREGVAFINIEVLESYLEDLLNSEVSNERLFIAREVSRWHHYYLPIVGLLLAVASGLAAVDLGTRVYLAFCLSIALALPFAMLLYFAPRTGLRRRMAFAQLVSDEVLRRRGRNGDQQEEGDVRRSELDRLMEERLARVVQGAARVVVH